MTNEEAGGLCKGCIYLHIGVHVDHNHCDKSRYGDSDWDWYEKRANGRFNNPKSMYHNNKCYYQTDKEK